MAQKTYSIRGGLKIMAPDDMHLLTPYVLTEQLDWFEDEIHFIREFTKPGMNLLDIGANYGVYTLSMANKMNGQGKLWSFEPCKATVDCLDASIQDNGFENIELIQAALSNKKGSAFFYTQDNAEMNSLSAEDISSENGEEVDLTTLDIWAEANNWPEIDFVKLDAEGEEVRILEGGARFFEETTALLMFELKHGSEVNMPLIDRLKDKGWAFYRLIPALNILIPFDPTTQPDRFQLNLFSCKPEKQAELTKRGLMVHDLIQIENLSEKIPKHWLSRPFMKSLFPADKDLKTILEQESEDHINIIANYANSLNHKEFTASERVAFLQNASKQISEVVAKGVTSLTHLATYARILCAFGHRSLAVKYLDHVIEELKKGTSIRLGIFLPAAEDFDEIKFESKQTAEWFIASVLKKSLLITSFSSYWNIKESYAYLKEIERLNFLDPECARRKHLIESFKK